MPALATYDLVRSFGPIRALQGVNLAVETGEMFGIVGPDGAGKTTLVRVLCGLLRPDTGRAELFDLDVGIHIREVRKRIGYLSQRFTLYGDLSVDENIEFFARIHNVRDYRERRNELLDFTRLTEFRDRLADRLSGGMKQKLALACTLIHTPDLIFLDEPTTGVDPVTRRDFWKLLASLMARGTTIILTTPYLDEAERCSRVAMMDKGQVLACDVPNRLRTMMGLSVIEVVCHPVRRAFALLRHDAQLRALFPRTQMLGERLDLFHAGNHTDPSIALLRERLEENAIEILELRQKMPSLENVFLSLLEERAEATEE